MEYLVLFVPPLLILKVIGILLFAAAILFILFSLYEFYIFIIIKRAEKDIKEIKKIFNDLVIYNTAKEFKNNKDNNKNKKT